jgi:hypothetical protein
MSRAKLTVERNVFFSNILLRVQDENAVYYSSLNKLPIEEQFLR